MTPLLTVKELSLTRTSSNGLFRKPDVFCLKPINFELGAGETMAIIGDNGSGKSTLARMLVGVDKPGHGEILLNGQKLKHHNIKQRCQNIRMIFQHAKESLNPAKDLGTLLDEALKLNTSLDAKQRRDKIKHTLTLVGLLGEHAYFYRHMLSDGQRQRAALARALILDPQVIVADEPFAALDPSVRSQTVNLLMRLQSELGLGFIFISHNLGIVRHISDRIMVMKNGEVIESGKADVIFNWPKQEYTKRLIQTHQSLLKR